MGETYDSVVRRKGAGDLSTEASRASGDEGDFLGSHCRFKGVLEGESVLRLLRV